MGQHARNRLTATQVKTAKDGWHNDGGNLHLRVNGDSKKWVFRYVRGGKATEIGLGSARDVSLKLAREKRDQHLETLGKGGDPREEKLKLTAGRQGRKTFAEAAAEVIPARQKTKQWRTNANDGRTSTLDDWTKNLTVDCKPISNRYVADIETAEIEAIVRPHWDDGHRHTARRVLKRIETVFAYAKAKGWRKGDNPATWAVFEHLLQGDGSSGLKDHHPALEWRETPAFMERLRESEPTMAALALEMMILTACRSGEVRGMQWTEIDFGDALSDGAVWTVPPERMKRNRQHEVPLSTDAVALLRRLDAGRINRFVFPGRSNAKPIAHWSCWALVQRLTGRQDGESSMASPHGFRASFRSWCTARHVPSEIAERCLAHERKDATQQAYDREEMLEARRVWMERWSNFLNGKTGDNVLPLKGRVRAPLRRA